MIFLKDNTLLKRRISPEDIKNRLLGHWGTCPGLIMVYAHLNRLIRKTGLDALYVVGPGVKYLIFQLINTHEWPQQDTAHRPYSPAYG